MLATGAAHEVLGRDEELAAIGDFLDGAPGPAALVLEGDPGIGKTTLWQRGVAQALSMPCTVLASRPAEADAQLSFAGLGDLLVAVLDQLLPGLETCCLCR